MTYHQLTLADRIAISTLGKEGLNASQIAQRLGRHRSTEGFGNTLQAVPSGHHQRLLGHYEASSYR